MRRPSLLTIICSPEERTQEAKRFDGMSGIVLIIMMSTVRTAYVNLWRWRAATFCQRAFEAFGCCLLQLGIRRTNMLKGIWHCLVLTHLAMERPQPQFWLLIPVQSWPCIMSLITVKFSWIAITAECSLLQLLSYLSVCLTMWFDREVVIRVPSDRWVNHLLTNTLLLSNDRPMPGSISASGSIHGLWHPSGLRPLSWQGTAVCWCTALKDISGRYHCGRHTACHWFADGLAEQIVTTTDNALIICHIDLTVAPATLIGHKVSHPIGHFPDGLCWSSEL